MGLEKNDEKLNMALLQLSKEEIGYGDFVLRKGSHAYYGIVLFPELWSN